MNVLHLTSSVEGLLTDLDFSIVMYHCELCVCVLFTYTPLNQTGNELYNYIIFLLYS